MRKDDISFRDGRASVNIKVPWEPLHVSVAALARDEEIPATLTEEWIRDNVSDEVLDARFWDTCADEYEYSI